MNMATVQEEDVEVVNNLKSEDRVEQFLEEIEREPRKTVSRLTKAAFNRLDPEKQRLIIVLEQIAYKKNATSGRELGENILGLTQAAMKNYLRGGYASVENFSPKTIRAIAKARGLSEATLRAYLKGEEPPTSQPLEATAEGILRALDQITLEELTNEVLPYAFERILRSVGGKVGISVESDSTDTEEEEEEMPHPGNLRLLQLLEERREQLRLHDENLFKNWLAVSFLPTDQQTPQEQVEEMFELLESELPLPNKFLIGPLRLVLDKEAGELIAIRDGEPPGDGGRSTKPRARNKKMS